MRYSIRIQRSKVIRSQRAVPQPITQLVDLGPGRPPARPNDRCSNKMGSGDPWWPHDRSLDLSKAPTRAAAQRRTSNLTPNKGIGRLPA
jgi:hypothetical protein